LQITEDEHDEYKAVMVKRGFTGLRDRLHGFIDYWRNFTIKIAVAGESGAGKSSFINSIRGVKIGDPDYAEVGNKETTMTPTMYLYSKSTNIELWDLPGFGSIRFCDRENFCNDVVFAKFDFILLLSANRFTDNDMWLAKEILKVQREYRLIFVRTQVDCDILRELSCDPTEAEIDRLLANTKKDCSVQLEQNGIKKHEIFLITNKNKDKYDYNALVCKLIETVQEIKKDTMILSLHGITRGAIYHKLMALEKRISTISKTAGVAGAYTNRDARTTPIEVNVMLQEAIFYREQLGLELEAIGVFAKGLDVDANSMLLEMEMESHCFVENPTIFADFYKRYDEFSPGFVHSLPLLGGWLRAKAYQKQCALTLKAFLDICAQDLRILHAYIGKALQKDTVV